MDTLWPMTMSCCYSNGILSYGFYEWYRPALVRACCQIKVWWWGGTLHPTTWIWNLADNLPFVVFLLLFCSISINAVWVFLCQIEVRWRGGRSHSDLTPSWPEWGFDNLLFTIWQLESLWEFWSSAPGRTIALLFWSQLSNKQLNHSS